MYGRSQLHVPHSAAEASSVVKPRALSKLATRSQWPAVFAPGSEILAIFAPAPVPYSVVATHSPALTRTLQANQQTPAIAGFGLIEIIVASRSSTAAAAVRLHRSATLFLYWRAWVGNCRTCAIIVCIIKHHNEICRHTVFHLFLFPTSKQ